MNDIPAARQAELVWRRFQRAAEQSNAAATDNPPREPSHS